MDASDFLPESIATAAFFTGHRIIPENMKERVSSSVYQCLLDAYDAGYRKFYCGCALGFDTLAAFQTVRLRRRYPDVILSLAIPCEDQSSGWKEKDRDIYRRRELQQHIHFRCCIRAVSLSRRDPDRGRS